MVAVVRPQNHCRVICNLRIIQRIQHLTDLRIHETNGRKIGLYQLLPLGLVGDVCRRPRQILPNRIQRKGGNIIAVAGDSINVDLVDGIQVKELLRDDPIGMRLEHAH